MPGGSYLAKLREAGFESAEVLEKTGYATSRYTEAFHIVATRGD